MELARRTTSLIAAAALLLASAGCSTNAPTEPNEGGGEEQKSPVLPSADHLNFSFDFFAGSEKSAPEGKDNYFNARIRVAIIQVVTEFILTPPLAAFALAIHTIPSPQPDGSYLWVYTWVDGDEEAQIRLRGKHEGDQVAWELRITALQEDPPVENELWFEGETRRRGKEGSWRFYDFNKEGKPVVARLDWDERPDREELIFTDLYENPGDELSYHVNDSRHSIDFLDASEGQEWFIRWDSRDGTGSLQVPDYHDGEEACWDRRQNDVECNSIAGPVS